MTTPKTPGRTWYLDYSINQQLAKPKVGYHYVKDNTPPNYANNWHGNIQNYPLTKVYVENPVDYKVRWWHLFLPKNWF